MEFLLQYLDDLDDLYGMVGLVGERLRRVSIFVISMLCIGVAAFLATSFLFSA